MSEDAVYVGRDGRFIATELSRGPWDPDAQHGGAPAALLMREFERCAGGDGLSIARVTYEFMRPVPLGELVLSASLIRPGRRAQLLEGSIQLPDGTEVMKARALRVRPADTNETTHQLSAPAGPEHGEELPPPFKRVATPTFGPDAIEIRIVGDQWGGGPATAWFRLRRPLVADEEPSPLQRLAAAGDFGNGISSVLSWDEYVFINPDLTLYVDRAPTGEWIGLEAKTVIAPGGVGIAESVVYDQGGRVGRAVQALLVGRR